VRLRADKERLLLGCPPGTFTSSCNPHKNQQIRLSATTPGRNRNRASYRYHFTAGRIQGDGPEVIWDLTGVEPGQYSITVEADAGGGRVGFSSPVSLTIVSCERCVPPCPTITVDCPATAVEGTEVSFTTNITGDSPDAAPTFAWTISAGTEVSPQGNPEFRVSTKGLPVGKEVTATVLVGGYPPECGAPAQCTVIIVAKPKSP
jgi:hypothetical protein